MADQVLDVATLMRINDLEREPFDAYCYKIGEETSRRVDSGECELFILEEIEERRAERRRKLCTE